MKKIFFLYRHFRFLMMAILVFAVAGGAFAQSTKSDKSVEMDSQTSLEGFTEAILINGQPVLRIIISESGNGATEVRYEKRDNEDALVFYVVKVPNNVGKLYVTKTSLAYVPDSGAKKYFKVEKANITKFELKDHWRLIGDFSHVNLEFDGDEKPIGLAYMNQGAVTKVNKKNYFAANSFLYRAIKDFDAALVEFNKLTASVRQNEEAEEEIEEETNTDVSDKYDRFKDVTIIATSKMPVRGNKRSIRTYAEYNFKGKNQIKPEKISLYFYASAARPLFREDNLELNFLVDEKRIPMGEMRLADEEKTKTTTKQTIAISIPYETFMQIAAGKKVEFQIGNLEYKLTDTHLEAFKKLLAYKVEE